MDFAAYIDNLNINLFVLVITLIFADIACGAALAFKEQRFRLQAVGDALRTKAIPFGTSILIVSGVDLAASGSEYETWAETLGIITYGTVVVALAASVLENLSGLMGSQIKAPLPGSNAGDYEDNPQ